MKKILFTLILFASVGLMTKLQAQCSIAQSSVIVNIKSVTANVGGGCTTVFDLTFDLANNGGNKWSHIHFWDANAYPAIVYGHGSGPNFSTLNGGAGSPKPVLATISLNYVSGLVVSSTYPPDNTVPTETAGVTADTTHVTLPTAATRFTITNISVHSNNCNPLDLRADVWSAQDNNGKNVACAVTGLSVRADEPLLRGQVSCTNPRNLFVSIATKSTANVTFTAYKDVAPFGTFDVNDQANVVLSSQNVLNTGDPSGNVYNTYGPYSLPGAPGSKYDVWVVASEAGINNSNIIFIPNSCAPLPVTFSSFTAQRSTASSVKLAWQTSTEVNNSGFAVERNINGSWEQVAFIPSRANGGNSSELLSYSYIDQNSTKGITQYRIRQIDINAKSSTSDIRAVRGIDQVGKTIVYPNPSFDGKVNVVFEDASVIRDVSLIDMSGRILKQWNGVSNNNLQIDNLVPGFYSLRVIARETGAQSVEKIVINKR